MSTMRTTLIENPSTENQDKPLMAHFGIADNRPVGSTDMKNPDTSTWNKNTEDADT